MNKLPIMKFILMFILMVVFLFLFNTIIVLYFIHDTNLSNNDIECAKVETRFLLHNPIERWLILKTVVEKKVGNKLYTSSYILGGIKYAEVEVLCNVGAKRL